MISFEEPMQEINKKLLNRRRKFTIKHFSVENSIYIFLLINLETRNVTQTTQYIILRF